MNEPDPNSFYAEQPARSANQPYGTAGTKKSSKKRIAILVAIVFVLIASLGVGAWYAICQHNEQVWAQEHKTFPVTISILSEDYDPTASSPVPIFVRGTDFEGNPVSMEAMICSAESGQIELMRGTYTVSVSASPFLADGSMFDVSASEGDFEIAGDGEMGQIAVSLSMAPISPNDLTEEIVTASKDKLVSLGFDEGSANQYVDAALSQIDSARLTVQLSDARAGFAAELEQLEFDFDNDPRLVGAQFEMNVAAAEYRQKYDALVNDMYSYLTTIVTGDELANLESRQALWEAEKEAASQAAGASAIGGSIYSMSIHGAAMECDRDRINELLAMMDQKIVELSR